MIQNAPAKLAAGHDGAHSAIQVEVFEDFERLRDIQSEWDTFIETYGGDIFLTYDWCRIWWKYYGTGRLLKIFLFRRDRSIIGIIPTFSEMVWLGPVFLRVVKIVGSDSTITTINIPLVSEYLKDILRAFMAQLKFQGAWDVLYLGPLAGMYDTFESLYEGCCECIEPSCSVNVTHNGVQTYVQLNKDWDSHLGSLSGNQRRTINRSYRDLSDAAKCKDISFNSRLASMDNIKAFFEGFVKMHQTHWQKLGKQGHFSDWPLGLEFHRETAVVQLQHQRLRLLEVSLGDCRLGYEYDFKFGDRYHAVLNARADIRDMPDISSSINIGCLLYGEQVRNAISENVKYIDMMRGEDVYKQRLGGRFYPVKSIFIFHRKPGVLVRLHLFRALAKLLNFIYYRVWFLKIAPRMPFKRSCLWRLWIRSRFLS